MTVIAWDGTTLAADRQRTIGGTPMPTTKVFKLQHRDGDCILIGAAGDSWDCVEFVRWVRAGFDKPKPTMTSLAGIMIDETRTIWYFGEKLVRHRITLPKWAIGSGCDYALGAMEAGKDAVRAVRIASKYDVGCGMGVNKVTF
jgi:ATP-dependent protease HslVU (ClpYQ) peptidase subunit